MVNRYRYIEVLTSPRSQRRWLYLLAGLMLVASAALITHVLDTSPNPPTLSPSEETRGLMLTNHHVDPEAESVSAVKASHRERFEELYALNLRQPLYDPPPPPAPVQPPPPPFRGRLIGTVVEGDEATAIMIDAAGKAQFMVVGQTIEHATIQWIESGRVRLEHFDQTLILTTDKETGKP